MTFLFVSFLLLGLFAVYYTVLTAKVMDKLIALLALGPVLQVSHEAWDAFGHCLIHICCLPLQGVAKYNTIFFQHNEILDDIEKLRGILLANRNVGTQRYGILLQHEQQFRRFFMFFSITLFVVYSTTILFPLPIYLLTGNAVLIYPLYLPFIDTETTSGYLTMNLIHSIWLVMTGIGLVASDGLMALTLVHIRPMVDLFKLGFEELNEVLVSCPNAKDSREVKFWLRNLTKLHQNMTRYHIQKCLLHSFTHFVLSWF